MTHRYTFVRVRGNFTFKCRWCGTEYDGPVCPVCAYK